MKKNLLLIWEYLLLTLGSCCLAASIVFFLTPNQIPIGGPPGIAIMLNYLTGLSIGSIIFIINLPLLLLGYRVLGRAMLIRTVCVVFLISIFTDLFSAFIEIPVLAENRLLNAIYGGGVLGLGIGLMFKAGASAGGFSILARIISTKFSISLGHCLFIMDSVIILMGTLVFNDIEAGMMGGIVVFVTARVIDVIVSGSSDIKIVHISCWKADRLKPIIEQKMGISGSILKAKSITSGGEKEILFLIIEKSQLVSVKKIVEKNDPTAYLVVMNAMEVYGTGART